MLELRKTLDPAARMAWIRRHPPLLNPFSPPDLRAAPQDSKRSEHVEDELPAQDAVGKPPRIDRCVDHVCGYLVRVVETKATKMTPSGVLTVTKEEVSRCEHSPGRHV